MPLRATFLKTFEKQYFDQHEQLTTDVSSCIESKGTAPNITWEAKNQTGALCLAMTNAKELTSFFQLFCPLNR